MPVKFKGVSDYKRNFKWLDSFRAKSFVPKPEQAARSAGFDSVLAANTFEPPLQRKKRVTGPPVSFSLDFFDSGCPQDDEYTLLGQQDKFASNVPYHPRRNAYFIKKQAQREASPPKQQKLEKTLNKNQNRCKSPPVVDTSEFTKPPKPKKTGKNDQSKKTSDVAIQKNSQDSVKSEMPVTPLAPRRPKNTQTQEIKAAMKDKNLSDVLGERVSKKKGKENMNEFVQTNMAEGVTHSAPEAPAEYAMKYKAGIVPPRISKKMSEYQREFEWKQGFKCSPLLAAQDMLYNDHVGPGKVASPPKTTEYSSQFKPWSSLDTDATKPQASSEEPKRKKKKVRRSKSVGARIRDAAAVPDDKQYESEPEQESKPIPLPEPYHGKLRKVTTEYRSNFKSPLKCTYKKGAWRGVDPPHLLAQKNENGNANKSKDDSGVSNWFAEVLELREKAAEYKRRAQGTHFSREHLVQLLAKQTDCWDMPTHRSSSTLSALSLESGPGCVEQLVKRKQHGKPRKLEEDFDSCKATLADSGSEERFNGQSSIGQARKSAWEEGTENKELSEEMGQIGNLDSCKATMANTEDYNKNNNYKDCQEEKPADEESPEDIYERENDDDVSTITPDKYEGRLPTPKLKSLEKPIQKVRHHLALTTPAIGGAILTSPPPQKVTPAWSVESDDTIDSEERRKIGKMYKLKKMTPSPTCGMPSVDTHVLRDDFALSDRPLKTHYVHSPVKDLSEESVDEDESYHPQKKFRDRPHFVPPTIKEHMGETYNKPTNFLDQAAEKDDDILSVSVQSIASSCSLASDLYERSKQRRDNFWTKGVATR